MSPTIWNFTAENLPLLAISVFATETFYLKMELLKHWITLLSSAIAGVAEVDNKR